MSNEKPEWGPPESSKMFRDRTDEHDARQTVERDGWNVIDGEMRRATVHGGYRVFPFMGRWSWHYTEAYDGHDTQEDAMDSAQRHEDRLRHAFDVAVRRVPELSPGEGVIRDSLWTLVHESHHEARRRGWLNHPMPYLAVVMLARVSEEVGELLEVFARQDQYRPSDKIPGYTRAEEEAADVVIKTLRIFGAFGLRPEAIIEKLKWMSARPEGYVGSKVF